MFATPEFNPIDPNNAPNVPSHVPLRKPGELGDASSAFRSEIYAAAWNMAQRDHEIDKLFNFEFYQGRDI